MSSLESVDCIFHFFVRVHSSQHTVIAVYVDKVVGTTRKPQFQCSLVHNL